MPSKQMHHWFNKLTSNSPFFFAILDKQHNYCLVNERYCDVAGLAQEELIGMNDAQILGDNFYQKLKPYYDRALLGESIEAEITLDETDLET
ncbi:TPA: PAS domain S-box protein, partial [Vibrio vulnificus]|nr:PAS domain S-box protein [Vibrio vulnificus]